jgi:hypothetical protein
MQHAARPGGLINVARCLHTCAVQRYHYTAYCLQRILAAADALREDLKELSL